MVPGYCAPVYLLLLLLRHIYSACAIRVCMCMNACLLIVLLLGLVTRFIISISLTLSLRHKYKHTKRTAYSPYQIRPKSPGCISWVCMYRACPCSASTSRGRTERERERERDGGVRSEHRSARSAATRSDTEVVGKRACYLELAGKSRAENGALGLRVGGRSVGT